MAMVAAGELDDFVALGVGAGDRIVVMTASVPELTKRTLSMDGMAPSAFWPR